jgi:hypothetical protein
MKCWTPRGTGTTGEHAIANRHDNLKETPPDYLDALQLVLIANALVVDAVALAAIAARISEFDFTPQGSYEYPPVRALLDSQVRNQLRDASVDEAVLDKIPYTIASVRELEAAAQIIAKVGICVLMKQRIRSDLRHMALFPFLQTQFAAELKTANTLLFADAAKRRIPDNPASGKRTKN